MLTLPEEPLSEAPLFDRRDPARALALLTRFPVRADRVRSAEAAWSWPLAGLAVGALAAATASLALLLGIGPAGAAGLALAVQAAATGALHEDGLADMADGVGGGATPARRLEIMRDSRIGTFGAMALILTVGLRWAALAALFGAGWVWGPLLAAAALSRAVPAALLHALPNARGAGLAAATGRPPRRTVLASGGLALGTAILLLGAAALSAALAAAASGLAVAWIARARLGGQTGDVCGAGQQSAEVGVLLTLSAL